MNVNEIIALTNAMKENATQMGQRGELITPKTILEWGQRLEPGNSWRTEPIPKKLIMGTQYGNTAFMHSAAPSTSPEKIRTELRQLFEDIHKSYEYSTGRRVCELCRIEQMRPLQSRNGEVASIFLAWVSAYMRRENTA